MRSILHTVIAVLSFTLGTSVPALADLITVDFTKVTTDSTAASFQFPCLTVTAKLMGTTSASPFTTGTVTNLFWGNLGALDTTASTQPPTPAAGSYTGLGVGTDSATGRIALKEALIFMFDVPQDPENTLLYGQMTSATDLNFRLQGTNQLTSGGSGFPADSVSLFIKVASGETLSLLVNAGALTPSGVTSPDNLDWKRWIQYSLNSVNYTDEHIVALAVEQTYGSATSIRGFGCASMTYEVPEPGNLLMLLTIGIGGLTRWKRKGKGKE